jgi:hypothetical protein
MHFHKIFCRWFSPHHAESGDTMRHFERMPIYNITHSCPVLSVEKSYCFWSKFSLFFSQNVYFWVKNLHLYSTSIPAYMYTDLNSSERPLCWGRTQVAFVTAGHAKYEAIRLPVSLMVTCFLGNLLHFLPTTYNFLATYRMYLYVLATHIPLHLSYAHEFHTGFPSSYTRRSIIE